VGYRESGSCIRIEGVVTKAKTDLLRGTLDLLILRTLRLQALHGVAIAERIRQTTGGTFVVAAGSLFPALHRLEHDGWIVGEWTSSEGGRRIRTYALTTAGRRKLANEQRQWERVVVAVQQVLESS
jgi:transcriptional regulator